MDTQAAPAAPEVTESLDAVAQESVVEEANQLDYSVADAIEKAINEANIAENEPEGDTPSEEDIAKMGEEAPDPLAELEVKADDEPEGEKPEGEEEDVDTSNWTPKASKAFQRVKGELKTVSAINNNLKTQLEQYEQRVKELEGKVNDEALEEAQKKLAEYEQKLSVGRLEETEAFKNAVTKPLDNVLDTAQSLAERSGIAYENLTDILAERDPQRQEELVSELFAGASGRDVAMMYRLIDETGVILEAKNKLLENSEEALREAEMLREQQEKQEAAKNAQLRAAVTKNVVEAVRTKVPFLEGIEGVDMDKITEDVAKFDPKLADPVSNAYNAVAAKVLPAVLKDHVALKREVEGLIKALAQYESAEPTLSSGSTGAQSVNDPAEGLSFAEALEVKLKSL